MNDRRVRNGKLEFLSQLVGGPADGTIVENDIEIVRIPKKLEVEPLFCCEARLMTMPKVQCSIYRRVSSQKLVFVGVEEF